ncbi:restriction endonuclease subunit S [Acidovorax temperans]|uniref:restriction endonuclease subunit S n=1 Tax=Acidovorax temperans TaxID=80878 RepID=UPI0035B05342
MELRAGYKQTEAGVIPEEWTLKRVGDFATTVASGKSQVGSPFGDFPVHGSTGVIGRCTIGEYSGRAALVARVGANAGKLTVVEGNYGVTDNTIIVKIDESLNFDFFWRELEAKRLNSLVFGSGQPLITGTQLKNLLIPVPPTKAEQEAIAEVLSDADALIESLDQLIAKKRKIKQGAMQALLTGKRRLPGFIGEWTEVAIKKIVQTPVTDGPHLTPVFLDDGVPFLSVNNLVDGRIDFSDLRYISMRDHEEFSRKCKPQVGDILLGKAASVGKVALVEADVEFNIWSPIALIRVNSKNNAKFVYYQLQGANLNSQIALLTNSSSQGNIGMGDIEKLVLPLPDKDEQLAIATVLSDMDTELAALESRLAKARQIKQGMMQELLTGMIRLL